MRSTMWAGLCCAFLTVAGVALAGPATAAPPALTATATFAKASYVSGQSVSVRLSVHNPGTNPAVGIRAYQDSGATELTVDQDRLGRFDTPTTIPAGGTVTVTVTGSLASTTATKVSFDGNFFDRFGNGVADFAASAPVTVRTAKAGGTIFGDANANGRSDPGEGLADVTLRLGYFYGDKTYAATSGPGGRFSVTVPTGKYELTGKGRGFTVLPEIVTVPTGGITLSLRAVRPLTHALKATIHFTKHTYAAGDTAHIVVALTNDGSTPLRGIGAACNREGSPFELDNTGPAWGDLAVTGPGVTLPAHRTRTFAVRATVPAAARRAGDVFITCDFGYPLIEDGYRPLAADTARVPGLDGAVVGRVQRYLHGDAGKQVGLGHVKIVLVDASTCPVRIRSATTHSDGRFRIPSAPAGLTFKVYVYPPKGWKVRGADPSPVEIFGHRTTDLSFDVVRGSAHVPTPPKACPTMSSSSSAPTSAPAARAPIANTGAHPFELAAGGGAILLAGLMFTLLGRRPRNH